MVSVLISFSRITILAFLLIFSVLDLIFIFEYKLNETIAGILSTIQVVMIVLLIINCNLILFLAKDDYTYLVLLLLQVFLFIGVKASLHKLAFIESEGLINNILLFLSLSFVFLERLNLERAIRQFVFAIVAILIAVLVITALRHINRIQRLMYIFLIAGILLLFIVYLTGEVEYGAKLSLSFGSVSIQPSEFVKITYLLFISSCIITYKDFRGFLFASIGAALHVLVLVFSKDLGTALIFLITYLLLIFIAYKNYFVLGVEIGAAIFGGILAYNLFPHIQTRFIAWFDPLSVIDDKGYQISQSLFAIGTGSWVGSGFTNGMPTKIPVVTKDFIFAAIAEEFGTVSAICIILCFMCTSIMLFNLAFNCTNSFYMLVVNGIGIIFSIQTILNIGGVIKFIPSTGVTLPFVSYGGSSLLSMFICLYIAECSNELK